MVFFAHLAAAALILVPVHILSMAWVGRLFGITIREISMGYGRPIYRRNKVVLRLWLPLGGYCKFKDTRAEGPLVSDPSDPDTAAFDRQSRIVQALVPLAGPFVLLGVGMLIGPQTAWASFVSAFSQTFVGGVSPLSEAQVYLGNGVRVLSDTGFIALVGLVATKLAAFNLFPLPNLNGGQALFALMRRRNAQGGVWEERLLLWCIWPWLALIASWMLALGTFVLAVR